MSQAVINDGCVTGALLAPQADGSVVRNDRTLRWSGGRFCGWDESDGATAAADVLIVPGFIDLHVHWPQGHVRGAFSGQLLPWLRDCIWPAEAGFGDALEATTRAHAFANDLLRAGTTTALTFGPPYLSASLQAGLKLFAYDGPALMEVNAPEDMCTPATEVLEKIAALSDAVITNTGFRRRQVVISPRFAPSMTREGLAACGAFSREHDLLVQSHVSENLDEVKWVQELFPEASDYTDVYDRAGLLGPRTVLAHGIHLSDRELARLAETGTVIAHCPTSNEALQSGRMPLERYRDFGVNWVLATDVGAGPLVSQLHVMAAFLAQHEAAGVAVTAAEALFRATRQPGAFLAHHDAENAGLGTLDEGASADLVTYAMPEDARPDDDAEALLRKLVAADPSTLEKLPLKVVRSGVLQSV